MKIQVIGLGCPTCKKLFEITKEAVKALELSVEVEYIADIQKIIQMGLMKSPVLVINNKTVLVGFTGDIEKIKEIIKENIQNE